MPSPGFSHDGVDRPHRRRPTRSEEHTSELQSQSNLVCRLLLEKKKNKTDLPFASLPNKIPAPEPLSTPRTKPISAPPHRPRAATTTRRNAPWPPQITVVLTHGL